jgi:nickel-dependent lactate racemase
MYSIREQGTEAVYRDRLEDVEISVEQGLCLGLAGFEEPPAVSWPEDFRAAFAAPLGTPMLRDLARGKRRVAVIVSDSTRGVPTAKVMPMVLEELADAGIRSKDITVVVARGVHRPATEDEIRDIVGEESLKGLTVINHDPYEARLLVSLGKTSFGTPVEVSRAVYEADLRISIGKVEPHEFAGFSGGRKSVLPGIASERTIEINHRPDMLMSPEARPGELSKNPIHLDMVEAAGMLKIHFTVNLVVNQAGETIGVFAGGIEEAHAAAVGFMRSFCQITLKEQPDIIVTTPGKPLNINFYQSVKPLIALAPVMAPGGVLVLYCSCRDGLGTEDMLIPYEGAQTVDDVIGRLNAEYKIQMDHALLLGKILRKGIRIVVATPSVDEAVLRKMFLDTASSPQEALKKAMNMVPNPKPKVLFFPQPQRALSVLDQVSAR